MRISDWSSDVCSSDLSSGGTTVSAEGDTDTNLTAFGEVGLNIALAPAFDLVPSYRYQWIDDGRDGFADTPMHVFRAGLRYWFCAGSVVPLRRRPAPASRRDLGSAPRRERVGQYVWIRGIA